MAHSQIDFLVVMAFVPRLLLAFDDQEPRLPRISTSGKIIHRHRMGVIPTRPCRVRRELIPMGRAHRYHRRTLFDRAIVQRINREPVPVHNLGNRRVVRHIDGHRHTLAQAKQRPRHLPVVSNGVDDHARSDLQPGRRDAQRVVRLRRTGDRASFAHRRVECR